MTNINAELIKEIEGMEPIKQTDSKSVIEKKLDNQVKVLSRITTTDAFRNQMARLGFGQPNLAEGVDYPMVRKSYNYNMFNSLYRSNWIIRKIVDVIPSDMVKHWITLISEVRPLELRKIENIIKKTNLKVKIKEGLKWARLYGGAAGLILIDGDDDLSLPLDYDAIMPDSFKGLLIMDRWNGIYPDLELEDDINDGEFGLPKYYNISIINSVNSLKQETVKVHHSRIIRFVGRDLPYWEKQQETYWGESEVEIVLDEIKKRDNTSANIASLIFLANIRVLKMNDLGQLLGVGTQQAQENLYRVLEAQNQMMSSMGIYVMDKDDEFDTKQYSFGGLNEIYESFMLDVAGATEMPVTKLFGRNPAGFNATGENDLTQYYETIEEKQEEFLYPIINKLLPIVCMSALGNIPSDLEFEFNPCASVSNADLAQLAQSMAAPVFEAYNAGLISKETALKELKQQEDKTGMWTNITDTDIAAAKEEEEQGDYTKEEKQALISEMNSTEKPPNKPIDKQNIQGNINTQKQKENAIEDVIEAQDSIPTWRNRVAALFNIGG